MNGPQPNMTIPVVRWTSRWGPSAVWSQVIVPPYLARAPAAVGLAAGAPAPAVTATGAVVGVAPGCEQPASAIPAPTIAPPRSAPRRLSFWLTKPAQW